jgi:alpha-L-rhamnosidase
MVMGKNFRVVRSLVMSGMVMLTACTGSVDTFTADALKCEYLINPIGVDAPRPRLTWQMNSALMGSRQSAYRIRVGTDQAEVAKGSGKVWDSGRVISDGNLVNYGGAGLKPFTRYYWSVALWNENGKRSKLSETAYFETGMLGSQNWKGSWISDSRDINLKPSPLFRKSFQVNEEVKSARIYIAAAGLYELYINGQKADDQMLTPAYTRFDRRTLYLTYDVTGMIRNGENVIGVMLGNGWYNHQSTAVWYFHEAPWRARPKFCLDLRITDQNDSTIIVSSGTDWKTATGPVIFNSIYTAEHFDGRLIQAGWDLPGFNDSVWKTSVAVPAPSLNITAQTMQPIRITGVIPSKSMTRIDDRTWVFDLGRNIAGISRIKVSGDAGTVIRLKHGERIDQEGRVDMSNIDVHYRPTDDTDPFQTDIFILSGNGEETFMPHFNYKGFQYVEVSSDKPLNLSRESLEGFFMHSDVPAVGTVESSDTLLNLIWKATNNSYLSNLHGYPTDCPQREKNGWTGDAHIAIETALYNFDAITVYEKWLNDHLDEQQPNGVLPAIIPTSGWGYHWANGPDWTSTIAIIPWNIYLFYGDIHLLKICYDNIKRYVDHITGIAPSGLTDWGLGDWIPVKSVSPREMTSTAYYFVDASILARAAKLLGKVEEYEKYNALAVKIKDAFNAKYLDRGAALYGKGLQTEMSVPLQWGLVPDDMRERVAENLARRVEADNQLDVGLLGTKAILNALSENGYAEAAYKLAARDTFPSWGWWIRNGATTLYENWPIDSKRDISQNHIMFGEIGAWMYKALGGIFPDEEYPGFKNIILKPCFVSGLDHFEAKHTGPHGTIVSSWKRNGDEIIYRVVVPANSRATFFTDRPLVTVNDSDPAGFRHIRINEDQMGGTNYLLESGEFILVLK